jgi:putative transposase
MREVAPTVGTAAACAALGVSRATAYRRGRMHPAAARRRPAGALSDAECTAVLDQLRSPRFVDLAPAEVYATLLDEGQYLCSIRTMYRLLAATGEVRERRDQLRHVAPQPELLATRPNAVWSWDITKLLGPAKWTYFYLYVILDIFSRYVVGWMVAHRESAALAERLIAASCETQEITPGRLTIHADRGSAMTSKPVALLLADLGVTRTHGRPHVSNDNPFSEAHFKTLKYRPEFPAARRPLRHRQRTARSRLVLDPPEQCALCLVVHQGLQPRRGTAGFRLGISPRAVDQQLLGQPTIAPAALFVTPWEHPGPANTTRNSRDGHQDCTGHQAPSAGTEPKPRDTHSASPVQVARHGAVIQAA